MRTTTSPSPHGATPPHPGAGRETHRKILPRVDGFSTTSRTSPTEKGGSMCREGGGKGSPGVITLMNPGPYWPLYLWGFHLGGSQTIRPLPRGGSSRPKVTRLVRYGPVRQKKNFSRLVSTTTGQHHTFGPSVGFSVSDEIHVVCLDEHQGIASRPVPMLSKVPRHPLALLL